MRRLLDRRRARRLLGLALVAKGLVGALAPRPVMRAVGRVVLREAYRNPEDLEPTDTYAELVRNASVGLFVAGALTLLRAGRGTERDAGGDDGETAETD